MPCAQLIFCRDVADFVRFAGPLGRYLLRRGIPWVILDSERADQGASRILSGRESGRKYFRGPDKPRLGDLAYTELPLFGP